MKQNKLRIKPALLAIGIAFLAFTGCPESPEETIEPEISVIELVQSSDIHVKPEDLKAAGRMERTELETEYARALGAVDYIQNAMQKMAQDLRRDRLEWEEEHRTFTATLDKKDTEITELREELQRVNEERGGMTGKLLFYATIILVLVLLIRIGPSLIAALSPAGSIASGGATLLSGGLSGILDRFRSK